jgi:uncharacterized protein YbjT (DUF2867 family)
MKIVVIGGTGLIGSKLVTTLGEQGHEVIAASPESGIACVTGEDLAEALTRTAVVVDATDLHGCEDVAFMEFFTASTRTLLAYEAAAGVTHHVALSAVGTERLLDSDYFRARCAQEQLIKESGIPYSIVRATQLFELLSRIADIETRGITVRVPAALIQPVAADDVIRLIAQTAVSTPLNGTIEVGGPEPFYLDGLLERILGAKNDARRVIVDVHARYLGAEVGKHSLVAGDEAELGEIRFEDWLRGTRPLEQHEFRVSDLPPGSVLLLGNVAVFSAAGGLCATQAMCTHRAGPLSEGAVDDITVTCPLHGARFNIWTGAVLGGPAKDPLKTYRVVVEGDIGRVDVD